MLCFRHNYLQKGIVECIRRKPSIADAKGGLKGLIYAVDYNCSVSLTTDCGFPLVLCSIMIADGAVYMNHTLSCLTFMNT